MRTPTPFELPIVCMMLVRTCYTLAVMWVCERYFPQRKERCTKWALRQTAKNEAWRKKLNL